MLTLWDNAAKTASALFSNQPVVAIRRAIITVYSSYKSLRTNITGGGIDINPNFLPAANKLHKWWLSNKSSGIATRPQSLSFSATSLENHSDEISERSNIAAIIEQNMGHRNTEKGDYITIKAYCTFIRNDKDGGAWYDACPNSNDPCRNCKITLSFNQTTWDCSRCGKNYPKPLRRWIFSAILEDSSSSTWVSFFNDQAELLLGGVTADAAFDMTYGSDNIFNDDIYQNIFFTALYRQYYFKCKVKKGNSHEINKEDRIQVSVIGILPLDPHKESLQLLSLLEDDQTNSLLSLLEEDKKNHIEQK